MICYSKILCNELAEFDFLTCRIISTNSILAMDVKSILSASRKLVDELDQYRQPWESKGHWHARKTFLRYHWEKFLDKDRLICLSSVWFNVHFMGNKYVMALNSST